MSLHQHACLHTQRSAYPANTFSAKKMCRRELCSYFMANDATHDFLINATSTPQVYYSSVYADPHAFFAKTCNTIRATTFQSMDMKTPIHVPRPEIVSSKTIGLDSSAASQSPILALTPAQAYRSWSWRNTMSLKFCLCAHEYIATRWITHEAQSRVSCSRNSFAPERGHVHAHVVVWSRQSACPHRRTCTLRRICFTMIYWREKAVSRAASLRH